MSLLFAACNQARQASPDASTPLLAAPETASPTLTPTITAAGATTLTDSERIQVGEGIYATNCAPCHHLNGEGNLVRFPALNYNPLVIAGQSTAVVNVVLHGRQDMPAFATTLTDQEIAAVVSYIRNAWDNQAPPVSPEKVQEVKRMASPD